MRILLVGAGGVGGAAAAIAARRDFVERLVVADYDLDRARAVMDRLGDPRLTAVRLDASDEAAVAAALVELRAEALLNATDPRFVVPLFRAALAARATYLDMAMSMSVPHRRRPTSRRGSSSATSSSPWTRRGARPDCSRWWASGWSRGGRTSSPATPRTTSSQRLTSWGCATART